MMKTRAVRMNGADNYSLLFLPYCGKIIWYFRRES